MAQQQGGYIMPAEGLFGNMEGALYSNPAFSAGAADATQEMQTDKYKDQLAANNIGSIVSQGLGTANKLGMHALGQYKDMSMFGQTMLNPLINMSLTAGRQAANQLPYQPFMPNPKYGSGLFSYYKGGGYGSL